ncbi:unnamed protein product [Blepharisma stoltei]|uniref:Vacuolar protein sorting-associated protein 8 central domain-containing protein n=1 Tax=Blepharisma stoltei TaxID=1481888 RepID=A0AAU9INX3_9CILI|nr:unnamed protein product [Blepharisma stoltei]
MEDIYSLTTLVEAAPIAAACECVPDFQALIATSTSLLYYHHNTLKTLPWFTIQSLQPVSICIKSEFIAILVSQGSLFIFTSYSCQSDHFNATWKRFIEKDFFSVLERPQMPDNVIDDMIDTIGHCLVNRERRYENHLDVTCLQINNQVSFTGMVWCEEWIIVSTLSGSLIVINSGTGQMERSFTLPNGIASIQLIETMKSILIHSGDKNCCLIAISDLLLDIKEGLKPNYLNFGPKAKVSYQNSYRGPIIVATYDTHIDIHDFENLPRPTFSFALPYGNHDFSLLWKKTVLLLTENDLMIIGKCYASEIMERKSDLDRKEIKICVCGGCNGRKIDSINYELWTARGIEDLKLWEHSSSVKQIFSYAFHDQNLYIITDQGLHLITELKTDKKEELRNAIIAGDINSANKLIVLLESRGIDPKEILNELLEEESEMEIKFKISVLSSSYPLATAENYISERGLWIEIYNYLWAIFRKLDKHQYRHFSIILAYILKHINEESAPSYKAWESSLKIEPLANSQLDSFKPFYNETEIDSVVAFLLPILHKQKSNDIPLNQAFRQSIPAYFNSLKPTSQIILLILAEQLSLDLPASKFLVYAEKLSFCKLLRTVQKLSDVELLFSSYHPLFSNLDNIISLLPLKVYKSNSTFTIKTTHIYHKRIAEIDQSSFAFGCVADALEQFSEDFLQAFTGPESFTKEFKASLTRFLMLVGYSIYKAISDNIEDTLATLFSMLLGNLKGFYDLTQITLMGSGLKCLPILFCVYEAEGKWSHAFKARLLEGKNDVIKLLALFIQKDQREETQALMIKYAHQYALHTGYTTETFISRASSVLPGNLIPLLHYAVYENKTEN